MKSLCTLFILLTACCLSQAQISDNTAYNLWFAAAAQDSALYQNANGFSDQDKGLLATSLSSYASSFNNMVNAQNANLTINSDQAQLEMQRQAAIAAEVQSLQQTLSASGFSWVSATVQSAKTLIKTSNTPGCNAVMCPVYSALTTFSASGGYAKVSVVTQGTTTVNYSACPACYNAAHTVQGVLQLQNAVTGAVLAGGSFVGQRVTPPSAYINYTKTMSFLDNGSLCAQQNTCFVASNPYILCTMIGSITQSSLYFHLDFEIAYTRAIYTGQALNCHEGLSHTTICSFTVDDYCTFATSPPDYSFRGATINDLQGPNWTYWDAIGLCERFSVPTHQHWNCYGIGVEGFQTVPALKSCTYRP